MYQSTRRIELCFAHAREMYRSSSQVSVALPRFAYVRHCERGLALFLQGAPGASQDRAASPFLPGGSQFANRDDKKLFRGGRSQAASTPETSSRGVSRSEALSPHDKVRRRRGRLVGSCYLPSPTCPQSRNKKYLVTETVAARDPVLRRLVSLRLRGSAVSMRQLYPIVTSGCAGARAPSRRRAGARAPSRRQASQRRARR